MCEPRLIILYKSTAHGLGEPNLGLTLKEKFTFQNNQKYPNIKKELIEETLSRKKTNSSSSLVISERLKGLKTTDYVYIDPYDYIKKDPALMKRYKQLSKLHVRDRKKQFRLLLNTAKSAAYENLEYFMKHDYDIVFVNPGDVDNFLDRHPNSYNIIVYWNNQSGVKKSFDYGDTHNISRILPHGKGVLILHDGKKVLEFFKDIKFIDTRAIKKMNEGDRILRYFKPDQVIGGFAISSSRLCSVILYMGLIAFVVLMLLFVIDAYVRCNCSKPRYDPWDRF